jgi:hypothetical protein
VLPSRTSTCWATAANGRCLAATGPSKARGVVPGLRTRLWLCVAALKRTRFEVPQPRQVPTAP